MSRTSRVFALTSAAAITIALAVPGIAMADEAAATFSRGTATIQTPNALYAGYTSDLGSKKSISGTLTLPKLGNCNTPTAACSSRSSSPTPAAPTTWTAARIPAASAV